MAKSGSGNAKCENAQSKQKRAEGVRHRGCWNVSLNIPTYAGPQGTSRPEFSTTTASLAFLYVPGFV